MLNEIESKSMGHMIKYFTEKGLALRRRLLKEQEEKVKLAGKEAGDEAGMNCDWHDNFGYEEAKRRLELESTILAQLAEEVRSAKVFAVQEQDERVALGVTVRFSADGESREVTVGALGESDPSNGLVSYDSPLVRAILGMEVGDRRRAQIVGNEVEIEVQEILPPSAKYHTLIDKLVEKRSQTR